MDNPSVLYLTGDGVVHIDGCQQPRPLGGNCSDLGNLTPRLIAETEQRLSFFANKHFPIYPLNFKVSFPWNRMFEVKIEMVE